MAPHGRAPRLLGWDYSRCGAYFVTLVVRDRVPCLRVGGRVNADLSAEGAAVDRAWSRLATHFDRVRLDEFVVMPDHVHGIIWLYECPQYPVGLGAVIKAWKGYATQEIRTFNQSFGWQTGYYDRIIRDRVALERVRRYIRTNHIRHGGNAT
jgi:putative transposase